MAGKYVRVPEDPETEEASNNVAVRMAIHRNAHLFESTVNLGSIVSRLRQREVVPASSTDYLQQPAVPNSLGAQNRNLMIWLAHSSPQQFEEFMRILKEDGERDNRGHEDLAEALGAEYDRINSDPEALQNAKKELNTIAPFEIINPKQLTDKLKEWCANQFRWCCCRVFLPLFIVATVLLGALAIGGYYVLHYKASAPVAHISNQQSPAMVSGSSDVLVRLDMVLTFVSSVTISVNCTGRVYYRRSPYCDNVIESTTEVSVTQFPRLIHHLNKGSSILIGYGNSRNVFIVIHSLEAYWKYLEFLEKGKCDKDSRYLVDCICNLKNKSHDYDSFMCYRQTRDFQVFNVTIEESDFYFVLIPYPFPSFEKYLNMVNYNRSLYEAEGFYYTPLYFNPRMQKYQARVPLPGNVVHERYDCMILSTDCPSSTAIYDVTYKFHYDVHFYYWINIIPGLYAVLLVSCITVQFCCYRRRRNKPRTSTV